MPTLTPQQAFDLAVRHQQSGRLLEARELCHQLLTISPGHPGTLHLLGLIARQSGSATEAETWLRQAITACPTDAGFHNDLADLLQASGDLPQAIALYQRALELKPGNAAIHNNLGNALKAHGRLDESITAFQHAIRLDPGLAEIHSNFASALRQHGQLDDALAAAQRAIALKPGYAMAYNNLGHVFLDRRQFDDAGAAFRHALTLQPQLTLALNNLGTAYKAQGREDEAQALFRETLRLEPTQLLALGNLANSLYEHGNLTEALPTFERLITSPRATAPIYSNYLATLHYSPASTLHSLAEAHREYERRYAQSFRTAIRPHTNTRDLDRPLRLGFISAYFGQHPVGFFLIRLLENLDRHQFPVTCYATRQRDDAMTARLRATTTSWQDASRDSDDQLADRIRRDHIDILFDLSGHTAGNRLLVFARKPAPIQITWLDYVGTTGLSTIDYLLADPRQVPPEAEPHYTEKILRLPDDYISFDAPTNAPPVSSLPALDRGHVTFASFNTVPKTTPQTVETWSRILHQVPNSRLLLKNKRFDLPSVQTRYQQFFAQHGIPASRLTFQGWSPQAELLATYNDVDLVLDTLSYNGGLTTCEALWMGVPVITCPGETFASRHSLTHMTAIGFTETIASTLDEYITLAATLAQDLTRLAHLRQKLRPQVAAAPLCNGPLFAQNFATLMRDAWRTWCLQPQSASI